MSNIFQTILNTARTVISDVQVGAKVIAPVAVAIPGAAAVDTAVQVGATAALAAIDAGEAIVTAASPEIASLIAAFESLFHITQTPQAIVLTPKTTAATVGK